MVSRSFFEITPPVGFAGELRMTIRVRGDRLFSSVSRSNENPRLSTSGTGIAFAPRKLMTDS